MMEKAATERSGAGGAGVDHWQWAADNPCFGRGAGGARAGADRQSGRLPQRHLDLHPVRIGLGDARGDGADGRQGARHRGRIRGADFRDEETKLLFAYDYTNRFVIRVWGHNYKPLLRQECGVSACAYSTASQ